MLLNIAKRINIAFVVFMIFDPSNLTILYVK